MISWFVLDPRMLPWLSAADRSHGCSCIARCTLYDAASFPSSLFLLKLFCYASGRILSLPIRASTQAVAVVVVYTSSGCRFIAALRLVMSHRGSSSAVAILQHTRLSTSAFPGMLCYVSSLYVPSFIGHSSRITPACPDARAS